MAMFNYALGKISGGTEGEGNVGSEGEAGGNGVGEGGNGGSGGTGNGGSGGTGEGGTGGSGGIGTGEGTGTEGSTEGGGTGESGVETGKNLKPQELLDELANSGVKYTPEDVILVIKMADGKLVWLERGNDRAGLTYIVNRHAKDFAKRGISDIPQLLNDVLQLKPIKTSAGDRGLTAEFFINGKNTKLHMGLMGMLFRFIQLILRVKGNNKTFFVEIIIG